ncbi:MAG: hypothetical protein NTY53_10200 [Kiritimatiellaeota bacterium]|nr:hypothetical protein [Kiritimatiellota bacterium]
MIFRSWSLLCMLLLAPLADRAAEECGDVAGLRAAIGSLSAQYGARYPGADFLRKLSALPANDAAALSALRREALAAHPALAEHPLLFVVRPAYRSDHHNTETMFQTGEINTGSYRPGGPLKLLDLHTGTARVLVDPGAEGLARDPDVFFDGQRVVFSMRKNSADNYHLYEVAATSGAPRQLTSAPGVFDIDPFYLADGRIAFTSSREPKYCGCNVHIMGNLFRMESDGANIVQLGRNNLFEGHGSLLDDGRIIYDRWEYVDRNFGDAQGLWTANPDGTAHATWYGNNTPSPGGVIEARQIPGTPLVLCPRPAARRRWPRARGADLAGERGGTRTRTGHGEQRMGCVQEGAAALCRSLPARRAIFPLHAPDRQERRDGRLSRGHVRQRGLPARRGTGLRRPDAADGARAAAGATGTPQLRRPQRHVLRGRCLYGYAHGRRRTRQREELACHRSAGETFLDTSGMERPRRTSPGDELVELREQAHPWHGTG